MLSKKEKRVIVNRLRNLKVCEKDREKLNELIEWLENML